MTLPQLIALAMQAAQLVSAATNTISEIRAVIARDNPEQLAEFDAAVASARQPSQDAADRATRENTAAGGGTD